MKRVYRAASLLQVAHARNVLIAAGVECELRNVHLAGAMGELPMMETWPQLYVADADETYALSILARAAKAPGGCPLDLRGMSGKPRAAVHLMLALRPREGRDRRAVSGPATGRAATRPTDCIGCASAPGRLDLRREYPVVARRRLSTSTAYLSCQTNTYMISRKV